MQGKIVGVFTVGFKNSSTGHSLKIDILVIENLFYKCVHFVEILLINLDDLLSVFSLNRRNIQETYDLKGSVRNRLANEGDKTDDSSEMQASQKLWHNQSFHIVLSLLLILSQVLMDENLLKIAREKPFYIRKDKNPEFYSAIQRVQIKTQLRKKISHKTSLSFTGYKFFNETLCHGLLIACRNWCWDKWFSFGKSLNNF